VYTQAMQHSKKIGLVLGSGSARGWSHIGVINALNQAGIYPGVICGCSVGSIIAAAYANGRLSNLQEGILKLKRWDLVRFFELNFSGGVIDSNRLKSFLGQYVVDRTQLIEDMDLSFACNATDLYQGREVSFTSGLALDAIWASIALPGLFQPVQHQSQWLVDGGLVNPVPISLARQLGAEIVIAVNLNGDLMSSFSPKPTTSAHTNNLESSEPSKETSSTAFDSVWESVSQTIKKGTSSLFTSKEEAPSPNLFDTMAGSINIMQDLITRSKMAGDPPDIVLTPRLGELGLLEFDKAEEAIIEGHRCVERVLPEIQYLLSRYD